MVHVDAEGYAALGDDEKAADEYAAILSKHKVVAKPEGLEEHQIAEAMDSFPKLLALGKRMMKGVDVAAFLKDADAFIDKNSQDPEPAEKYSDLKDVKIDGDKAAGKAKSGEFEKTFTFKKAGGRWFVSIETLLN